MPLPSVLTDYTAGIAASGRFSLTQVKGWILQDQDLQHRLREAAILNNQSVLNRGKVPP